MFLKSDLRWTIEESPYISVAEEHFIGLCKQDKIPITSVGNHKYSISFDREYLDDVEKKVKEHCDAHNINYKFYRGVDGTHHYEFSRFIEFCEESEQSCQVRLVSYDAILDKYKDRDGKPIKIPPKTWFEKLLSRIGLIRIEKTKERTEMDYFYESLGFEGYTPEAIAELKFMSLPYYED